jgi:DNA-dependent RNA polymerase auxiliary subunit epsilon
MQRLYLDEKNCPVCSYVYKILNKKIIYESIRKNISIEKPSFNIKCVPTLIDEKGCKFEGENVVSWLRQQVEKNNFNVEEIMNPHHSEFHRGNKRFMLSVVILLFFLKMKC